MSENDKKEYLKSYYLRHKKALNVKRYVNMKKNDERNREIQWDTRDKFIINCF